MTRFGITVALAFFFLIQDTWAQQRPADGRERPSPELEEARRLYDEGLALLLRNDFEQARAKFLVAWTLKKHWQIAGNLGASELALGMFPAAAEHLTVAIRIWSDKDVPAGTLPRIREELDNMRRALAEARMKVGTIETDITPAGAEVFLDGTKVGSAPLLDPLFVDPEPHQVEARLAGYVPASIAVAPARGSSANVRLVLRETASHDSTPVPSSTAEARRNGTEPSSVPHGANGLSEARPFPWVPVVIGGGLTLISLGIGLGFRLDANSAKADADRALDELRERSGESPCWIGRGSRPAACDDIAELHDRRGRSNSIASAALISSAALAGATVIAAALWPNHENTRARSIRVTPMVGSSSSAIFVVGDF